MNNFRHKTRHKKIDCKRKLSNGRNNPQYRKLYYEFFEKKPIKQIKSNIGYHCLFCGSVRMSKFFGNMYNPELVVWLYKGRGRTELKRNAERLHIIYQDKLLDFLSVTYQQAKLFIDNYENRLSLPIKIKKPERLESKTWQNTKYVNTITKLENVSVGRMLEIPQFLQSPKKLNLAQPLQC